MLLRPACSEVIDFDQTRPLVTYFVIMATP